MNTTRPRLASKTRAKLERFVRSGQRLKLNGIAIVSAADLELLERLEDEHDAALLNESLRDDAPSEPAEDVFRELGL